MTPHKQTPVIIDEILKEAINCPLCGIDGNIHINNIQTGESTDFCMFCGHNIHHEIEIDIEKEYIVKYAEYLLSIDKLNDSINLLTQAKINNSDELNELLAEPDNDKCMNLIDEILNNKKNTIPKVDDNGNICYQKMSFGGYGIIHLTTDTDNPIDPTDPDNTCLDGMICIRDNEKSNVIANNNDITTYHMFGNPTTGITSLIQLVNNSVVYSTPLSYDKYYNENMFREMENMQAKGVRATSFMKWKNDIIEV